MKCREVTFKNFRITCYWRWFLSK